MRKPLKAQEALDELGPIPLASLHHHETGEFSPIIRDGGIIERGIKVGIVGVSSRAEMLAYYEKAGWGVSREASLAPYYYKAVAE